MGKNQSFIVKLRFGRAEDELSEVELLLIWRFDEQVMTKVSDMKKTTNDNEK